MSLVNIQNVSVVTNPAPHNHPFQFQITFDCIQELAEDLEWRVVYVANAEDSSYDQVLEEVMVGPVPVGINQFVLEASCPDYSSIRNEDLIGVTVVLVTCSYMNQEFLRIGYYVRNEYSEPFEEDQYPNPVDVTKLTRNILVDEPRVTRIPIQWDGSTEQTMTYDGMVMGETDEMQAEDDALDAAEGDEEEEEEEGEGEGDEEADGNNAEADNDDDDDDRNEEIDLGSEDEEDDEDDEDDEDEMDQDQDVEEEEEQNPNVESVAEA